MEDNRDNVPEKKEEEVIESNASRRLKALGAETEPADNPDPEPQKKAGFFENLWYHYKTPILIALGFVIIFAVGITQMVRKKNPDIYVLYAGPAVFDNTRAAEAEVELSALITEDSNNDGKYSAQLTALCYVSEEKAAAAKAEAEKNNRQSSVVDYAKSQENRDAYKAFSDDMLFGDSVICLLDPYLYGTIRDAGGLLTLEEALGLKPEGAIDDYGIPARLIPFFESTPAFSTLPEDTVFTVRRVSTMSAFTGKDKEEKAHARHVAFARALIAYVPEETEQTAE
ncbi:MAG: hypothetical protein IKH09_05505 [Clostridia bacterium]|nr:hypothetical protein [Clostridia bacterium]